MKGLWVWSKPIQIRTDRGEIMNIMIIDSEGLGDAAKSDESDTHIFALCVLLCSVFLYNSKGAIDGNQLLAMSNIMSLTEDIKAKNSVSDDELMKKCFPILFWIARDFTLSIRNPIGQKITDQEYLDSSLSIQDGSTDSIQKFNEIRTRLKDTFSKRN